MLRLPVWRGLCRYLRWRGPGREWCSQLGRWLSGTVYGRPDDQGLRGQERERVQGGGLGEGGGQERCQAEEVAACQEGVLA